MNQEIKVTKCRECPKLEQTGGYPFMKYIACKENRNLDITQDYKIHPHCPLKGQSITYKIGESNG